MLCPLLLSAALVALSASSPLPAADNCCFPVLLEGNVTITDAIQTDQTNEAYLSPGSFHFDAANKRMAHRVTVYGNNAFFAMNVIQTAAATYVDIPAARLCSKLAPQEFRACVPSFLKKTSTVRIGVQPGLDLDVYSSENMTPTITGTVSEGCVPASLNLNGPREGKNYFENYGYYNLATGIKDKSVFDLPSYCGKSDSAELSEEVLAALSKITARTSALL